MLKTEIDRIDESCCLFTPEASVGILQKGCKEIEKRRKVEDWYRNFMKIFWEVKQQNLQTAEVANEIKLTKLKELYSSVYSNSRLRRLTFQKIED